MFQVEAKFSRDFPTCLIDSSSYDIHGSYDPPIHHDEAVFRILYHCPTDRRPQVYERRFGMAAEGWIELPKKENRP
jgi:hypothetical protein